MLIVGDNLLGLIHQENICPDDCYDNTCISLSLGFDAVWLNSTSEIDTLEYEREIPSKYIQKEKISDKGLLIPPHKSVLSSSMENIVIPVGYWGLVQTKGSLARLLVSLQLSDGQVDPGFNGKITFEISNNSDFNILIRKGQKIGNLYLFKASTNVNAPYNGRYQNATGPTIHIPKI